MPRMRYETGPGRWPTQIGRAWWLPVFFLLATTVAAKADDFTYTLRDGAATITGYSGPGGAVTIPSTMEGRAVASIGLAAFEGCNTLTSVTIPDSVTSIGGKAFFDCTSLTTVTIPSSVTSIGSAAFASCASLTTVTIPDSVTSIGGNAFCMCFSLTNVVIGKSVISIGGKAFFDCPRLTGVYFGGNAPILGSGVFDGDGSATIYYSPGTTGWGATFGGRPTERQPGPTATGANPTHGPAAGATGAVTTGTSLPGVTAAETGTAAAISPTGNPASQTADKAPLPAAAQAPTPPAKRAVAILYRGVYEGGDAAGRQLAFLRSHQIPEGTITTTLAAAGQAVVGVTVKSFTPAALVVMSPAGEDITIGIGKEREIPLE